MASGSKSTVLTELRWFVATVFSAFLIALKIDAAPWVLYLMAVILGLICIVYLAGYIFFAFRSPDYLRSEKFTLSKMAIERSITGDNISGLIDPDSQKKPLQLPPSKTEREGL